MRLRDLGERHHDNCAFGPIAINRHDLGPDTGLIIDVGCSQSVNDAAEVTICHQEATDYLSGRCPNARQRVAMALGCAVCPHYWPIKRIGGLLKDESAQKYTEELDEALADHRPHIQRIGE